MLEIDDIEEHIHRERNKAKTLKKSNWWKNRLATGICHYCQEKFKPAELTMDHIVPLSRGGTSTKNNLVPSCKSCNSVKRTDTPVDLILQKKL